MVSDPNDTLDEIHWCYSTSLNNSFCGFTFVYTSGEELIIDKLEDNSTCTCGEVTGLSGKIFTSACYHVNDDNKLTEGFQMNYSGGSITVGP